MLDRGLWWAQGKTTITAFGFQRLRERGQPAVFYPWTKLPNSIWTTLFQGDCSFQWRFPSQSDLLGQRRPRALRWGNLHWGLCHKKLAKISLQHLILLGSIGMLAEAAGILIDMVVGNCPAMSPETERFNCMISPQTFWCLICKASAHSSCEILTLVAWETLPQSASALNRLLC